MSEYDAHQALIDQAKARERIVRAFTKQKPPSIDLSRYAGTYGGYRIEPRKMSFWQRAINWLKRG